MGVVTIAGIVCTCAPVLQHAPAATATSIAGVGDITVALIAGGVSGGVGPTTVAAVAIAGFVAGLVGVIAGFVIGVIVGLRGLILGVVRCTRGSHACYRRRDRGHRGCR